MKLSHAEIKKKLEKLSKATTEAREFRQGLRRLKFNISHNKPIWINPKKNKSARRKRPSPEYRLNRGQYVWPRGISESKYDAMGKLR